LRGMEWVGWRVFKRGYWKGSEKKSKEIKVLDPGEGEETDSIIKDEVEGATSSGGSEGETAKRWT